MLRCNEDCASQQAIVDWNSVYIHHKCISWGMSWIKCGFPASDVIKFCLSCCGRRVCKPDPKGRPERSNGPFFHWPLPPTCRRQGRPAASAAAAPVGADTTGHFQCPMVCSHVRDERIDPWLTRSRTGGCAPM